MRNQTGVSIPRERADQLRTLARHHNSTASGLIGGWIDHALAAAGLDARIPGTNISRVPGHVAFRVPAFEISLTPAEARNLAEALERAARLGRRTGVFFSRGIIDTGPRGSGVEAVVNDENEKRSWIAAPNVARAVATQLRSAADGDIAPLETET